MSNQNNLDDENNPQSPTEQLEVASGAVGALIAGVRPEQWSAPTPCTDWTVRRLVDHLVGMNRVFAALLTGQAPPGRPAADFVEPDPAGAFAGSARDLANAFAAPGVLDREFASPMGSATGAERLQIRLYDLLAHGWDLATATGQRFVIPDQLAEQSLAFARTQLADAARPGRFAPAQSADNGAPAIDRLAAFLGRSVGPAG